MKTIICGLALLGLAACSTKEPELVYVPAPTTTEVEIDVVSLYPSMMQLLWADFSAEDREGMCSLYEISPETVRDAFLSNVGTTIDRDEAWIALRDLLDEEC